MNKSRRVIISLILIYIIFLFYRYISLKSTGVSKNPSTEHIQLNDSRRIIYVAVVVCGERVQETLTMIKSALLFAKRLDVIKFIIIAEEHLKETINHALKYWRDIRPPTFYFEIKSLTFPNKHEHTWKGLFKPCAAQRLFLPSLLSNIDAALYVDTDTIFLSPVSDIWSKFSLFNSSHLAGLTAEHEDSNAGWYNRFARHPFYGKLGVNSGVMLMNLTRMRQFEWENRMLPIFIRYKLKITWGDQDIINILFSFHSEKLYIFPCDYNYRPDHCLYTKICNIYDGIKLLHGNRGYFHSKKQPFFSAIYDAVKNYQIGTNSITNFLEPLRESLKQISVKTSYNCDKAIRYTAQNLQRYLLSV